MTDDYHNKTIEIAVDIARKIKDNAHASICKSMWLVFATLYQEMIRRKEITPLKEIGKDKALLYWTEACVARPEATKFKRICITQALYMYDMIIEKV